MNKNRDDDRNMPLTVHTLLSHDKYTIPFYQRNYAWGEAEVMQLLSDIQDMAGGNKNYYIGTLVVAWKESKNMFEIVDGQQRHTTLSIIYAVLCQKLNINDNAKRNLYFDARKQNEELLKQMLEGHSHENLSKAHGNNNFLIAMQTVERFLENHTESDIKKFYDFFSKEVIIFRVLLPDSTDLNHYFEIMNNRGEQLEKHEILKAAFMNNLDEQQQLTFAKIWDACSNMDSHVQMNFLPEERIELFGNEYGDIPTPTSLQTINLTKQGKGNSDISTLENIINNHDLPEIFSQEAKHNSSRKFTSIIDFPNFLLQVLSLTELKYETSASLDDKKLLEKFGYPKALPKPMEFIYQLLHYRILFDRYVIKRKVMDEGWNWTLQQAKKGDDSTSHTNTIKDDKIQQKLIMLQSMFHVTFTGNTNKKWLFKYLKNFNSDIDNNTTFLLLQQLEKQAKKLYKKNIESTSDLFNQGLKTPRFLFNYTDYLLWNFYYENVRGKLTIKIEDNLQEVQEDLIKKIKIKIKKFQYFKFVQRSSIEHLFPQSLINTSNPYDAVSLDIIDNKAMNCFGNLCLISRSSNSAFRDHSPERKKQDATKRKSNESLKQQIMFASFDEEGKSKHWGLKEIEAHDKEIKILLKGNKQD